MRITGAGLRESHVHDVTITRESPNYPSFRPFFPPAPGYKFRLPRSRFSRPKARKRFMFRSDGRRLPNRLEKILLKAASGLRGDLLLLRVRLDDKGYRSVYSGEQADGNDRCVVDKEEGTMRWIDGEVRAGDIFMDIGANIGIYTLAAAHRVGKKGRVYAFEPHKVNGITLLRNLEASGLADRVDFFACALSDAPACSPSIMFRSPRHRAAASWAMRAWRGRAAISSRPRARCWRRSASTSWMANGVIKDTETRENRR